QLNAVITSLKDYAKLTDVDQKIAAAIAGLKLLTETDVTNTVTDILNNLTFDTTALEQLIGDTINNVLQNPTATLTQTINGLINSNATIQALTSKLSAVCSTLKAATVTLDQDGNGNLQHVTVP